MLTIGRSVNLLTSMFTLINGNDLQLATTAPVPIRWTAIAANSAEGLIGVSQDRQSAIVLKSGIYDVQYAMNVNLVGTKGNIAAQQDITLSYLEINGIKLQRSSGYGNPLDLVSGDYSVHKLISHKLNVGDAIKLIVRRLSSNGNLRIAADECSLTFDIRSVTDVFTPRIEL